MPVSTEKMRPDGREPVFSLRLPRELIALIDRLTREGGYPSRSEFVRTVILRYAKRARPVGPPRGTR